MVFTNTLMWGHYINAYAFSYIFIFLWGLWGKTEDKIYIAFLFHAVMQMCFYIRKPFGTMFLYHLFVCFVFYGWSHSVTLTNDWFYYWPQLSCHMPATRGHCCYNGKQSDHLRVAIIIEFIYLFIFFLYVLFILSFDIRGINYIFESIKVGQ